MAISNSRLIKADNDGVTFRVKNCRVDGDARYTTMTLAPGEFVRRVLLHVLPKGFHRIRHAGFLASSGKAENIAKARALLEAAPVEPMPTNMTNETPTADPSCKCPCCGGTMHIIETFQRGETPATTPNPRASSSESIRHEQSHRTQERCCDTRVIDRPAIAVANPPSNGLPGASTAALRSLSGSIAAARAGPWHQSATGRRGAVKAVTSHNPHRESGTTAANHPAGSFPDGFRTTAPVRVESSSGPSSETLYSTSRQGNPPTAVGPHPMPTG